MARKCAVKVRFWRTEEDYKSIKAEMGIGVGSDPSDLDLIVDISGQKVETIWQFNPRLQDGLIWFDL